MVNLRVCGAGGGLYADWPHRCLAYRRMTACQMITRRLYRLTMVRDEAQQNPFIELCGTQCNSDAREFPLIDASNCQQWECQSGAIPLVFPLLALIG